ncbi:MAG: response regulator [Algoriphagus aquaeductus]|jgi:CheY-like chemotaxis protein|uniref:Response regulator receiver domain-containing protein n=1 Tax=Algoriphagus aquaeductus TaxID=475299 RepID=A0A326RYC7_9BACT|nr:MULTISPECIES: response regulator [Algoriphagus]PZV87329.1 response regulator receiver domain-containing protein [Algoriphagus aquaeductus]
MNFDLIIVDDDPEYIFFHKLLAKKSGISETPLTFAGGQEIINYLSELKDKEISNLLIFLDIYMTDIDGWGVLDYLQTLNRPEKIKVILITSSVSMDDKKKAIKYPSVIEYIEKPLMMNYLINLKDQPIFI